MDDQKIDFLERLGRSAERFTKSDKKIANFIAHSYPGSLLLNASEISKKTGVNISTVTRFFSKLGYRNSRDIQEEFRGQIGFLMNSPLDRYHQHFKNSGTDNTIVKRILELDLANITNTFSNIEYTQIEKAADLIRDEEVGIYIVGERKEFSLAYYLFNQLNATRNNVFIVTSSNAPDYFSKFKKGDLSVIFDFRRYPSINERAAGFTKKMGGRILSLVDSPVSPVFLSADFSFLVYTQNISAFDSYTAAISLLNIIVAVATGNLGEEFNKRYDNMRKVYHHFSTFQLEK